MRQAQYFKLRISNLAPLSSTMDEKEMGKSTYFKYISLVTLTFQNALLILTMRYTRVVAGALYITTTAVVISESLKLVICLVIIFVQEKGSIRDFSKLLYNGIVTEWRDTLKMSVPAIVYMIQNNLQYVAVSNLEAAVFQVTYQMKILTTALFSVLLLSKKLSPMQWVSLLVLFGGVALVQLQGLSSASKAAQPQHQAIGLIAVAISCLSSGFAGVYFEKMLKGSNASVWLRNVQLGMFGSITAVIGMWINDRHQVSDMGFFFGYTPLVWTVIVQQAIGGLIVALVVRYADNILKGFATSLSIVLSCIASVFLFDYIITFKFSIGAFLVMLAIYLYGQPQQQQSATAAKPLIPLTDTKVELSNGK